ncbi:SET (Su(var)3-9, Enhancer-of-zeste, Trithorax) domain [Sparganum proliferum]
MVENNARTLATGEDDPLRLSEPIRLLEWICHLRAARNPSEQNLELIRQGATGRTFYRVIRFVNFNEELLFWFRQEDILTLLADWYPLHSEESAAKLLVFQLLRGDSPRGGGEIAQLSNKKALRCGPCQMTFLHIYPYICHRLFRCQRPLGPIPATDTKNLLPDAPPYHRTPLTLGQPGSQARADSLQLNPPSTSARAIPGQPLTIASNNPIIRELFSELLRPAPSEGGPLSRSAGDPHHHQQHHHQLTRNWCAKCWSAFQLTSDLVQHMRRCQRSQQSSNGGPASAAVEVSATDRGRQLSLERTKGVGEEKCDAGKDVGGGDPEEGIDWRRAGSLRSPTACETTRHFAANKVHLS